MRIDLAGRRFGRLTVREKYGYYNKAKSPKTLWICDCDCGNESVVRAEYLLGGNTNSCGCLRHEQFLHRAKDLTGQRFGRLVVRELDMNKDPRIPGAVWICDCDCGEIAYIRATNLVRGNTRSCGCLRKENPGRYGRRDKT